MSAPPLLDLPRIVKLTDAAQALLRAGRRAAKQRAAVIARELDLFDPALHYANHEDYAPTGDQR